MKAVFTAASSAVTCVAFTEDEKHVCFGSDDSRVYLGDLEEVEVLGTFDGHLGAVRSVAIALGDSFLFSGDD